MNLLRKLPKIDKLVAHEAFVGLNKKLITSISRLHVDEVREKILAKKLHEIDENSIIFDILHKYHDSIKSSLIPLINATGIILHTNLGRAPLHVDIFEDAKRLSCGYSNLEFNMNEGKRGERYEHVSHQLRTLLNVEDVLIVNNNASAVFLILNTFAKGKKAILSRGELVEIGGSFRVPDVMKESGCKLKEIGTTNKTKLKDYKKAISKKTSILMKVHRSNFSMKGFTQSVSHGKIVKLAKKRNLIDYYDVGGAYVGDFGFRDDGLDLKNILKMSPSLVSFSGDKLFGSVQSGIIVGKKKYIDKLKQNQLLRMLRVDKVTLSLLEASVKAYLEDKLWKIPTHTLLNRSEKELEMLCQKVSEDLPMKKYEIVQTSSFVGGGTMPEKSISSFAIHIKGNAQDLQKIFRQNGVIGRIEKERFLLDFRSVLDGDIKKLTTILKTLV